MTQHLTRQENRAVDGQRREVALASAIFRMNSQLQRPKDAVVADAPPDYVCLS